MSEHAECVKCPAPVCRSKEHNLEGPPGCPTREKAEVIGQAVLEYDRPEVR